MYLNPALCRMLGEERPEDYIGQHLSIYYSEESNRRGKQEIEPALMRDGIGRVNCRCFPARGNRSRLGTTLS